MRMQQSKTSGVTDRTAVFIRKIADIVLRSRIRSSSNFPGVTSNTCHVLPSCPATLLTLDILFNTLLLERWTITVEPPSANNAHASPLLYSSTLDETNSSRPSKTFADDSDLILLVQSLYSHIRLLPLHSFVDLLANNIHFSLSSIDGSLIASSSPYVEQRPFSFQNKAKLKNYKFKPAGTSESTLHLSVMYDAFLGGLVPKDQLGPSPLKSSPLLKVSTSSLVKSYEAQPSPTSESPTDLKMQRQSSPFPSPKMQRRVLSLAHARTGLGMSILDDKSSGYEAGRMVSTPLLPQQESQLQQTPPALLLPHNNRLRYLNDPAAIPTLHIESPTTPTSPEYSFSLSYTMPLSSANSSEQSQESLVTSLTPSMALHHSRLLSPTHTVAPFQAFSSSSLTMPSRRASSLRSMFGNDLADSVRHWSLAERDRLPLGHAGTSSSMGDHEQQMLNQLTTYRALRRPSNFLSNSPDPLNMSNDTATTILHPHSLHEHYERTIYHRPTAFKKMSNSEPFGSLVGSYEESILSGRMSTLPSKPIHFIAEIGVIAIGKCRPSLKCPHHIQLEFPAFFYELEEDESPTTPYVGTIDLRNRAAMIKYHPHQTPSLRKPLNYGHNAMDVDHIADKPEVHGAGGHCADFKHAIEPQCEAPKNKEYGYRLPSKGQLQIIIKNPSKTAIKVFLVPYDFSDMPPNTKTFIRQKSYEQRSPSSAGTPTTSEFPLLLSNCNLHNTGNSSSSLSDRLRFAVHLQFQRTSKGRIYLCKTIRVVFNHRAPDKELKLRTVNEGPMNPKYIPLSTPSCMREDEITTMAENVRHDGDQLEHSPAYPFITISNPGNTMA